MGDRIADHLGIGNAHQLRSTPRVAQIVEQRQQRQAEDGEMAALDLLEQLRAQAFDPVAADAAADRLIFRVEIGLEEGVAELAHVQRHASRSRPRPARRSRRPPPPNGDNGCRRSAARSWASASSREPGLLSIVPSSSSSTWSAPSTRSSGAGGSALRLHLGEHLGQVARLEACRRRARLRLLLVERRRHRLERARRPPPASRRRAALFEASSSLIAAAAASQPLGRRA